MATHPVSDFSPYFANVCDDPMSGAFDEGRQAHPRGSSTVPVPKEQWGAVWETAEQTPRTKHGMAYVHVPFCENHCLFCGFYQNAWKPELGAGYVDQLLRQAETLRGKGALEGPPLRALYFGGGTPTALAAKDIGRMVRGLRDILPLAPDCEITLEGRIFSFTPDKQDAAFEAGVNRISLGVQTFDTAIRKRLGRKASGEEVKATLSRLVAQDAAAIVIDLIYGLPNQTHETWARDIATVDDLGLDGVDHYGLNMIKGTPLMASVEKGKLTPLTRSELGEYYARGHEQMKDLGWAPISCSHYQSPSLRERSVYNYGAKTGWDFFALGAGAGGSLNGLSYFNIPMLETYAAKVSADEAPFMGLNKASAIAPLVNAARAGMERARLDTRALEQGFVDCDLDSAARAQKPALSLLEPLLAQWVEAGLMARRGRFYELTLAGRFWQVQMTGRLTNFFAEIYLPPAERRDPNHRRAAA